MLTLDQNSTAGGQKTKTCFMGLSLQETSLRWLCPDTKQRYARTTGRWSFFFSKTSYSNIPSLFISVFPKSLINERWDRRASEERHRFQDYSCNPDVLVNVLIYTTWERERRERSKADRESYLEPFQIWNEPRLPPTRWLEPAEEVIWTEADKRGIG